MVVFEARNASAPKKRFQRFLEEQSQTFNAANSGVRVKQIREINENEAPYRRVYDPSHPEADNEGYVNYPNVNIVEEMII